MHGRLRIYYPGGDAGGGPVDPSPFQARAEFLKNRSWKYVASLNRGACERGGAAFGFSSEDRGTCEAKWREFVSSPRDLGETIDFLRNCHRLSPFLFFNGNTFAAIGRTICNLAFKEIPVVRRQVLVGAIAHYIAGVLDRESMVRFVEELSEATDLKIGDRVESLKGSLQGEVTQVFDDGRIEWQPDGGVSKLTCSPESVKPLKA